MKNCLLPILSLCVVLFAASLASASDAGPGLTADEALRKLMDGNLHFLANQTTIRETSTPSIREALRTGQEPFAIILSCSDSRVPPEIIFDQGLGEIFVVRVAGNIRTPLSSEASNMRPSTSTAPWSWSSVTNDVVRDCCCRVPRPSARKCRRHYQNDLGSMSTFVLRSLF